MMSVFGDVAVSVAMYVPFGSTYQSPKWTGSLCFVMSLVSEPAREVQLLEIINGLLSYTKCTEWTTLKLKKNRICNKMV